MSKQAALKSRELRKAQAAIAKARGRRRNWGFVGGTVVIVGLVIAIVASLINSASSTGTADSAARGPMVTPAGATAAGALTVGSPTAPVKVSIYLDYMCPYCGRFERANAAELDRLVADGTVKLDLYPMSFLDRTSGGSRYSTRAANAAATVADRAPDKFLAFNQALFAQQPEEGSRGLSDKQLANVASEAGVPREVIAAFGERIFEPWVVSSTEAVFKSGIAGTPTVKINGEVFAGDLYSVGPLGKAITAAKTR